MSDWTGVLYGFYTNKPISFVFNKLQDQVKKIGYSYEYSSYNKEEYLLFYKNTEMLNHHLDNGYNVDLNGEGCFSIEAKIANLHGIASLFEFDGCNDFKPYDINLSFNKIYYYVLVLPVFIEESSFSEKIHSLFRELLYSGPQNQDINLR